MASINTCFALCAAGLLVACGSQDLDPILTSSSSGATGSGGASSSTVSSAANTSGPGSGSGGGASSGCKRGVATNTAPGAAFSPKVGWWYDWGLQSSGGDDSVEFVPMVWGSSNLGKPIPSGSKFLLGFNEPNFHAQSNLTPQAAAAAWPDLTTQAAGAALVSPAMNFCGPADQCNGTDPYQYLKDFFAACPSCKVDYVAVHWYNCDLPSLKDYLEPGGNLEGFEQFNKPIWLTEFSCGNDASVADQQAFMEQAVPYLEANPHVFRYSWFSADPIPNAKLINGDGSPTPLGEAYIGLDESCSN